MTLIAGVPGKISAAGGAGFLGTPLTQILVARGWGTNILIRKPGSADARAVQAMGGRLLRYGVIDRQALRKGIKGGDAAVQNAGWHKFGITNETQGEMRAINVQGAQNARSFAREIGIPKSAPAARIVAYGQIVETCHGITGSLGAELRVRE